MIMRRTEKNKENNISFFPLSIKLVLLVVVVGGILWTLASVVASFGWVLPLLAAYFLIRLVWCIIKLVFKLVFSLILLFLLISLLTIFIL